MATPLKLSVVISTYNRREALLSQCLPAILHQDLPADQYEVIVIVDGSTDGTGPALRELRPACALRILEQPNSGLSRARNTGIQMARGELVMFIDDDIVCRPDVIRRHVEAHAGTEPTVVHGAIYGALGTPASILGNAVESWYREYNRRLAASGGAIWPEGVFLIGNSSTPRSTLLACGGLDEDLPAMDDFELGLRLWKMGVKFQYLPDAVACELSVKGWRSYLFNDGEAFGRSEVLLCRKYPDYRQRSGLLAGMGRAALWRRTLKRIAIQAPLSPAYLFVPPIWVCDKLCRFPLMQKAGLFLLGIARYLTQLRAAYREVGSWKNLQAEFAVRLPALLYHRVGPPRQGPLPGLTVSPARFERHVRWLARNGFQGICPADWLRWLREGTPLPKKPILLTFDDAYEDIAEFALPILRRYGFGGAVYVVTKRVGETNLWNQAQGSGTLRLMNKEQIRFWAGQGIEFGAHSRTHRDLTKLSAGELEDEVAGSKRDLAALLDSPVESFAYPYGYNNDAVRHMVRRHFAIALTTDEGINDLLVEPHLIRRAYVAPSDPTLAIAWIVRWGTLLYFHDWRGRIRLRTRIRSALGLSAS